MIIVAVAGLGPAAARALTPAESAALAHTVDSFEVAMQSDDFLAVTRDVPPRVLKHLAAPAGVEVEKLRQIIAELMADVPAEAKVHSFKMNLAQAHHRELADGTPYLLIPTETVVTTDDGKMAMRSHTLALLDESVWYLLRISEAQQLAILRQVYPEYVGVDFPTGSMEALRE